MAQEQRLYRGFPDQAAYYDWKRRHEADLIDAERDGSAERERQREDAARFNALPSLDQIERRHGKAARDRIAALNLPQHRADFAQAAE
ncbi:MAG: hypothetical protein Unbinned3696contig1008_19 [Prokaryotic dsDNA virus sp.]|uniref:hypothetical protein n=1 Tax=Aurantimonas sp. NFXS3 TaxID=2818434 RepID=UPI00118C33DB|nr:MAG: hypothetical protein Unbinned3696contig1008_19 [Prokaryotic dsDNA virus sp.]|tara:strand:+ start:257 stop:520 length:264 start_codon:yes stop_codon:yes gene_type:complete